MTVTLLKPKSAQDGVRVIDGFLPEMMFNDIQELLMGSWFQWYFAPSVNGNPNEETCFQFVHQFFGQYEILSDHYKRCCLPILDQLDAKAVMRIKANMQARDATNSEGGWHVDYEDSAPSRTAILYINDNNGYTRFKDTDQIVYSKANRLVDFPSHMEHTGATQTDTKARVVMNINYLPSTK